MAFHGPVIILAHAPKIHITPFAYAGEALQRATGLVGPRVPVFVPISTNINVAGVTLVAGMIRPAVVIAGLIVAVESSPIELLVLSGLDVLLARL